MIIEKVATIYECCEGHWHRWRIQAEECENKATYLEQCEKAIAENNISALRVLLKNKPKDITIPVAMLNAVVRAKNLSATRALLESKVKLELTDALWQCVADNNIMMAKVLILAGADGTAGSPSALDQAEMEGKTGMVELIKKTMKERRVK